MDKPIPKEILERFDDKGRLRPTTISCESCGQQVNRREISVRANSGSPYFKDHIKFKCITCGYYRNPESGRFEMTHKQLEDHFRVSKWRKR